MKLLIRADDLGYSEGINYGIEKAVKEGIVANVGIMVNMPAVAHGIKLLKNEPICFGCHVTICAGKPVTDPTKIPSLTTDKGEFKASKVYRGSADDFVVFEEALIEVEAQFDRFVELMGRKPDYMDVHALGNPTLLKAIKQIADKYGVTYSGFPIGHYPLKVNGTNVYMSMDSSKPDYDPYRSLKEIVEQPHEDGVDMLILHPGYLDAPILKGSSLTTSRPQEVELAIDPVVKEWFREYDVELIDYRDL
ncbi:ChbG/HpnK family deacetylase [Lacticigenium naphthae]|uniref:ChbG/HpnK family deacetylase n=1 Tax=Lacticigenium naphthae TaxID=515351 RepID=UPI00041D0B35|nr:ChbG/HpnK family deacetylase [Lacticigenium naphthae]